MKVKTWILVSLLLMANFSFSQLTFTSEGKTVTSGSCETKDLKVDIPVTQEMMQYDLVRVWVKNAISSEESSSAVYIVDLRKDYYSTQKSLTLWLKRQNGNSSFSKDGYNQSDIISWPCNYKERSDQFWTLSFGVMGLKISGYRWENSRKIEQYNSTTLVRYPDAFKMDYGPVDNDYVSYTGKFSFMRVPDADNKVHEKMPILFAGDKAYKQMVYQYGANDDNNDYIMFGVRLLSASEYTIEQVQNDLINALKKYANQFSPADLRKLEAPREQWVNGTFHIQSFYPGFVLRPGKSGNKEFDKKAKELKKQPIKWIDKKVGNLDCKYLELDVYFEGEFWKNSSLQAYVKKEYQGKTRKLVLFVGSKNDDIFVGAMIKDGKDPVLSAKEKKFWDDALNSFKVL